MSSCQKCGSIRIGMIQAHSKDLGYFEVPHLDIDHDGYFPDIAGICGGDDVEIDFCFDCGQIQGSFPIEDETIVAAVAEFDSETPDVIVPEREPTAAVCILWNDAVISVKRPSDLFQHPRILEKQGVEGFKQFITTVDPGYEQRYLVGVYQLEGDDVLYFYSMARIPMGYLAEYLEIEWEDYIKFEVVV